MSDTDLEDQRKQEKVPWLQELYDRPFVLLILGVIVMFGFYTVWGLFEILTLPKGNLP